MNVEAKDVFLLLAGFILSIVATAIWQWWSLRSEKSKQKKNDREIYWNNRINNQGSLIRSEDASDLLIRSMYWFVLASLTLAVSGLCAIFNVVGIYDVASLLVSLVSFAAVIFFMNSLSWLRLYLRLKDDELPPMSNEEKKSIGG